MSEWSTGFDLHWELTTNKNKLQETIIGSEFTVHHQKYVGWQIQGEIKFMVTSLEFYKQSFNIKIHGITEKGEQIYFMLVQFPGAGYKFKIE